MMFETSVNSSKKDIFFKADYNGPQKLDSKAVRMHWGVENKVHYCLDVTFGEDQNRARTRYAAANLSTLRKMTMNILRQEPSNKSLIQKQRKAARSPRFLLELLKLDA